MKPLIVGMVGFALMASLYWAAVFVHQQYKKSQLKESILIHLACDSPSARQAFSLQCVPTAGLAPAPTNSTPAAPTKP